MTARVRLAARRHGVPTGGTGITRMPSTAREKPAGPQAGEQLSLL